MLLRVTNFTTAIELPEDQIPHLLSDALGISRQDIQTWKIIRKSLDARQKNRLRFVYSVVLGVSDEVTPKSTPDLQVSAFAEKPFDEPIIGAAPMPERPVVVGSGPAGLLAGYYLALRGYRPIVLERGQAVKDRVPAIRRFDSGGPHENENNYLFGEGGAGCFSDGKLTCRISGPDVDWVLNSFVDCGGRRSLIYEHRPHLGSNKLPMICRNYRRKIEALGGEYRFECRLEGLRMSGDRLEGLETSSGFLRTDHCVLAIGHSARDTYEMLNQSGLPLQQKAFQLGLRIEHPQELINNHKYGRPEYLQQLGAADYSLVAKGQPDLFTFCMCAGGVIIPSVSEQNMFCSNGMSNSRHDTVFGNSGLVVTLDTKHFGSSHPLAGMEMQRKYESLAWELTGRNYHAPIQRASDFLADRLPGTDHIPSSYQRGTVPAQLAAVVPPPILSAIKAGLPIMDEKWKGQYLPEAVLVGPEMRGSSPVRIARDRESWQVPDMTGIYPVGEGAGYAGGIVTAAVDGLRAAKKIVSVFAPPA